MGGGGGKRGDILIEWGKNLNFEKKWFSQYGQAVRAGKSQQM